MTTEKVTYGPNERIVVACGVRNRTGRTFAGLMLHVDVDGPFGERLTGLEAEIGELLPGESKAVALDLRPFEALRRGSPSAAFVLVARLGDGVPRARWVFDVSPKWSLAPRYGFFTDYPRKDARIRSKIRRMMRFHINAIQFYDWFKSHGDYMPAEREYSLLRNDISLDGVLQKVGAAREAGMKAMAYTVIYAASKDVYEPNKDSALLDARSRPLMFGNWLYLMNPGDASHWSDVLIGEFIGSMSKFLWDGIHLDQYGEQWTRRARWRGKRVDVEGAFVSFINRAVAKMREAHPQNAGLVFNNVNAWPLDRICEQSETEVIYIEVWPPNDTYGDIVNLIRKARRCDKSVVVAAYTPNRLPTILLLDALVFSNRASRIEVGEGNRYLIDAYFPKNGVLHAASLKALEAYYETITRYQEFIYHRDVTELPAGSVRLAGRPASTTPSPGKVFLAAYSKEDGRKAWRITHLVNFCGISSMKWDSVQPRPRRATGLTLEIGLPAGRKVARAYFVSPDSGSSEPSRVDVAFERRDSKLTIRVPYLTYWDMVMVELEEEGQDHVGA